MDSSGSTDKQKYSNNISIKKGGKQVNMQQQHFKDNVNKIQ